MKDNKISIKEIQDKIESLEIQREIIKKKNFRKKYNLTKEIKTLKEDLEEKYINSLEFSNLEKSYQELITETSNFFKKMDVTSPIAILSLYSYLIKNGYLSLNHKFVYQNDMKDCLYLFGTNVVYGKGVCRHITTFLTDIYQKMGYNSCNIGMVLKNSKDLYSLSRQEFMEEPTIIINRRSKTKEIINSLCSDSYNHLVTLVNDENGTLIVDPTNDAVFYVNKNLKIIPLSKKQKAVICDYIPVFNSKEHNYLSSYLTITNKEYLNQISNDYNQTWDTAANSNNLFNYFYNDNHPLYQDINQKRRILSKEVIRYVDKMI